MDNAFCNILIIEPDHLFSLKLKNILKENSHVQIGEIRETDSGYEGLSILMDSHYDYVFISEELIDCKGTVIIRYINRYYYRRSLQIIALVNNAELTNIKNIIESGAVSYIEKDKLTIQRINRLFNPIYSLNNI